MNSRTLPVGALNAYYQSDSENFINQGSVVNESFPSFWRYNNNP